MPVPGHPDDAPARIRRHDLDLCGRNGYADTDTDGGRDADVPTVMAAMVSVGVAATEKRARSGEQDPERSEAKGKGEQHSGSLHDGYSTSESRACQPMDLSRLTDDLQADLARYRFDEARLRRHAESLAREGFRPEAAHLPRPPLPPPPGAIFALDESLAAHGRAAIARGELACVVLAGGMATRFGGVVKAAAECLPGRTFLDLKLADAGDVPVALMASRATEVGVRAEVLRLDRTAGVFTQSVSLRLTPQGELFLEDAAPSPYAPGHGDLLDALRVTGTLRGLRARGARTILVSNVDNLGASPDPALFGLHLSTGRPVTVEVVDRGEGDRGGAPGIVDGRLEIVEAFRVPPGTDLAGFSTFNTNTFWLQLDAIDRGFDLDEFAVKKEVGGLSAIQFESLIGQVTHFLDSTYVRVPRGGAEGRFTPVKDPEELALRRPEIEARLRARGVVA